MHVTIGPGGTVRIPKEVRDRLMMPEGDEIELRVTADGVLLVPVPGRDPDQWWFWTDEWQAGEREVDEAIRQGKLAGPMDPEQFEAILRAIDCELDGAD